MASWRIDVQKGSPIGNKTDWVVEWEDGVLSSIPFTIADTIKAKAVGRSQVGATPIGPFEPVDLGKSYIAYKLSVDYLYSLGFKKVVGSGDGIEWPGLKPLPKGVKA